MHCSLRDSQTDTSAVGSKRMTSILSNRIIDTNEPSQVYTRAHILECDYVFYLIEEAERNRKTNWCFALQSVPMGCFAMEHPRHITQSDGKWPSWVQEQTKSHWHLSLKFLVWDFFCDKD